MLNVNQFVTPYQLSTIHLSYLLSKMLDVNQSKTPYHIITIHLSNLRKIHFVNLLEVDANQIAMGQATRARIKGRVQVQARQEAGTVTRMIVETMIQDTDEKIPIKDEGAVHIIAVAVCQVADQEGAMGMVQTAMSATMMKNGTHTWQLCHHSTISI